MPPPKNQKTEISAASTSSSQESLEQLKKNLLTKGGLIKNINDARKHTDTTGITQPNAELTTSDITKILLSLVATTSTKRGANDRIRETANIIKAVALLLPACHVPQIRRALD